MNTNTPPIGDFTSDPELRAATSERRLSAGLLIGVIFLLGIDVVVDMLEGEPFSHVILETTILSLAAAGFVYLWFKAISLEKETLNLQSKVEFLHKDKDFWKKEAGNYLRGLGESIDKQFELWKLTEAEKDVCLFLLKGYSHKEIAQLRETSDRTIRQQAASVYNKAELDGRAQLSAFFLEDLLLPTEKRST